MLQCNTDTYKRNKVVHKGVAIPSNSSAIGYNSALASNSDVYLPEVNLEGGTPSKIASSEKKGTMNPLDIYI